MFGYLTTGASPFDHLRELQQHMDQVYGGTPTPASIRAVARGSYPPINVGVTPDAVEVFVFAAGMDPQKLDISIQQNVLTVAGARNLPLESEGNYYVRERYDGDFRRAISLPEDVDGADLGQLCGDCRVGRGAVVDLDPDERRVGPHAALLSAILALMMPGIS